MTTVPFGMPGAKRDFRIDWLRGLAMTCVIINHSKLSSPLSWFTYERFWVVTAAEVFVVLSGVVLGMVYCRRLLRDGWTAVVRGLARRAALLYFAFVAVAVSLFVLGAMGLDVTSLTAANRHSAAALVERRAIAGAQWRDVLLMRAGPWAFEIIGLYVWLVAAAIPCLLILRRFGWRVLLAASWGLYLWYRFNPHPLTAAGFETAFPLLAWQLLFVHGITIGFHRDAIGAFVARLPRAVPIGAAIVTAGFTMFAWCNPWADAPSWLHVPAIAPERFAYIYGHFFLLSDLQAGRLLNLAIGLPMGYALLTRYARFAQPLEWLFVTLGRQSLGAFVLHVYGLLLIAHLRLSDVIWMNVLVQTMLIVAIAGLLDRSWLRRPVRRPAAPEPAPRLAA